MGHRAVLVPGAWHGPWAWEPLLPLLERRGLTPVTVDLPSTRGQGDRRDDVAVVRAAITASDDPVVLVGHSYGGMVITEAAAGIGQVSHLVYVAAFLLDVGDRMLPLTDGRPQVPWFELDERTGLLRVPDPVPVFYHDVDADIADGWSARLGLQTWASFVGPLTDAAWRDVPSTYVVTTDDRAIPPDAQRAMAAHATHTVEIDSGHSPVATHPAEVADVVAAAARVPARP